MKIEDSCYARLFSRMADFLSLWLPQTSSSEKDNTSIGKPPILETAVGKRKKENKEERKKKKSKKEKTTKRTDERKKERKKKQRKEKRVAGQTNGRRKEEGIL